jgi:hypothetical protein
MKLQCEQREAEKEQGYECIHCNQITLFSSGSMYKTKGMTCILSKLINVNTAFQKTLKKLSCSFIIVFIKTPKSLQPNSAGDKNKNILMCFLKPTYQSVTNMLNDDFFMI